METGFPRRTCANQNPERIPNGDALQLGNFTKGTNIMTMNKLLRCGIGLGLLLAAGPLQAQQAALKIQAVTQPGPALPQFTRVDQPLLKEGLQKKSGGKIELVLASWPERNLNGPEIIRLVRSGQVDIGAAPLDTLSRATCRCSTWSISRASIRRRAGAQGGEAAFRT